MSLLRKTRLSGIRLDRIGSVILLLTVIEPAYSAPLPKTSTLTSGRKLSYNRDIRPILAENCFACHGPDSAARKADLRLDRPAEATALRGDHAVIVRGKPAVSEMIRRITGQGSLMPPPSSHKTLTSQQIQTLTRWVSEGAAYESHWSYLPPRRTPLPPVKNTHWARNPIDRFILARLEQVGLQPAPEADRRTLARRLSLDLTGLPPSPAEVESFVNDHSPNAYEKLVDHFLASPAWGEHRARYWLDAARYADTNGIHFDNYREIYSYRDWVIQAFNANERFDQFTIEQLAGDLLPHSTLDQRIATGFNRCNITTNEGGVIPEEYAVFYTRDRTETTCQVWLGTTAGCAVCHDHKFDPLSQRDFYSMSAFFNNTTQEVMDGNVKDTPPTIPVPQMEDRERWAALPGEIGAEKQQVDGRRLAARADFDAWIKAGDMTAVAATVPTDGMRFHFPLAEGQGKELQATFDGKPMKTAATAEPNWDTGEVAGRAFQRKGGSTVELQQVGDFEKDQSFSCAAWVKLPANGQTGAVIARMDDQHDYRGWDLWIENNKIGTHIINKWPDDALKVVSRDMMDPGRWHHVCMTYSGGAKPDSVHLYIDGMPKDFDVQADALKSTIRTTVPFKLGQRYSSSGLEGTAIQDVRLYGRALSSDEAARLARGTRASWLTTRGASELSAPERDELFAWYLTNRDAPYREYSSKLASLQSESNAILARGTVAHVANEKKDPAMAFVLYRGAYDQRRDQVKPTTPPFLPAMPADFPRNRLGFAKWLLLPEQPLTARVTVNRFWQEVFGTGIVRTAGDFGVAGELPSHPELLDWLAVEFREDGWDIKKLFKLMVTSATYRQSARVTPEKKQKDPQNRLLSRGPRFRMDAEMVRDYALAASGLLSHTYGGPSVKPYQPDGVWEAVAMIGSNTRDYRRDTGDNLYRRSLYTFWKRAAPPASMEIFNAPTRETCAVRRERTDTPLQALVTLNDVQFVEAARMLAQRALKEGGATAAAREDYRSEERRVGKECR